MSILLRAAALALLVVAAGCHEEDEAGNPLTGGNNTGAPPATGAAMLLGLTDEEELIQFRADAPGTILGRIPLTGKVVDVPTDPPFVTAMDIRPSDRRIYVWFSDNRLYTVNSTNGALTLVGQPAVGGDYIDSIDFNPVTDVLRAVSDEGDGGNYRVNPADGTATADTRMAYAPGDPNAAATFEGIDGVAYTGGPGATQTTAYVIDANKDILATLGSVNGAPESPNGGKLFTVGPLGIFVGGSGDLGFDIETIANPVGYVSDPSAVNPNDTEFYRINLGTGALTRIGALVGDRVLAVSVFPGTGGSGGGTTPPPPPPPGGAVGLSPGDELCTHALAGTGFTAEAAAPSDGCLMCDVADVGNLVDADFANAATATLVGALAASVDVTISAPDGVTVTPDADGSIVGAVFALPGGDPGELALLPGVTIATFNDGTATGEEGSMDPLLLADFMGMGLIPVGEDRFLASFNATLPFDSMVLTFDAGLAGINTTIRAAYACHDAPAEGAGPPAPGLPL